MDREIKMDEKMSDLVFPNSYATLDDSVDRKEVRPVLLNLADNFYEDLLRYIRLFLDHYDKESEQERYDVGFILRKVVDVLSALHDVGYYK